MSVARIVPLLLALALVLPAAADPAADALALSRARLADPALRDTLLGILAFLDDNQVRDRPGRRMSVSDASDAGEGCRGRIDVNLPFLKRSLYLPAVPPVTVRNVEGEWASDVHFLPKKGVGGKALVAVPDSNLFVPAFVAWPLHLLREEGLPPGRRVVASMMKQAWHLDRRYKRGNAYNFWLPLRENPSCVGPYNIPLEKGVLPLAKAYLNPRLAFFWRRFAAKLNVPPPDWVTRCLDAAENPTGAAALFNIPDDADDTATAVALQAARRQMRGLHPDDPFFSDPANFAVDEAAFDLILRFRDRERDPAFEDGRDAWKGEGSGAFLTWLRDEREPTFSRPETGVIPLGRNNVDAVVNCNVLLAAGLLGRTDSPGVADACRTLKRATLGRHWPACGLYYPQNMIFPYTLSRAYRDGGVAALAPAARALLPQLIREAEAYAARRPDRAGAFPGGEDRTDFVATALGLVSLLNLGRDMTADLGLAPAYDRTVEQAVRRLLADRRTWRARNPETMNGTALAGTRWDSGLFFSASFWDLAHWRSEAFTDAMALEALAKYALAYERGGVTMMRGRRLVVTRYPDSAKRRDEFALDVR